MRSGRPCREPARLRGRSSAWRAGLTGRRGALCPAGTLDGARAAAGAGRRAGHRDVVRRVPDQSGDRRPGQARGRPGPLDVWRPRARLRTPQPEGSSNRDPGINTASVSIPCNGLSCENATPGQRATASLRALTSRFRDHPAQAPLQGQDSALRAHTDPVRGMSMR